jgi:hypothetical protein
MNNLITIRAAELSSRLNPQQIMLLKLIRGQRVFLQDMTMEALEAEPTLDEGNSYEEPTVMIEEEE